MYNDIKLDKSLYAITGKTFTQALTQLDPDESYKGTDLEGLDAFERQLKRFDIRISGSRSDKVKKFFETAESATLFPEYIRRAIQQGMEEYSIAASIVAAKSYTDSLDYRAFVITDTDTSTTGVNPGADIPAGTVSVSTSGKSLSKFAKKYSIAYEAVKNQRLDALSVILKSLGASIASKINSLAVTTALANATGTTISGTSLTYADLAAFWACMTKHNMNVMVCSPEICAAILALDEMKFCVSDYMTSGKISTPYGVTIVKCNEITSDQILGLDNSCAMEMFLGSDVVIDYDKLLTNQTDEVACSVTVGFAKIFTDAVKTLTVTKD